MGRPGYRGVSAWCAPDIVASHDRPDRARRPRLDRRHRRPPAGARTRPGCLRHRRRGRVHRTQQRDDGPRQHRQPGHRLPPHCGDRRRDRRQGGRRRLQPRQHPAEHGVRVAAGRRTRERDRPSAGPSRAHRHRPGSGVRPASVDLGGGLLRRRERAGGGRRAALHRSTRQPLQHRRPGPDHRAGLPAAAGDLLLRHRGPVRCDPEHPRVVRRSDVDADPEQRRGDRDGRRVRVDPAYRGVYAGIGDDRPDRCPGPRYHVRHRRAGARPGPGAAAGRLPVAATPW